MAKTIVVVGFGPGISSAVAEKFGSSGFSVGLVARSEERLAAGVKALKAKGIEAAAFPADASDPRPSGPPWQARARSAPSRSSSGTRTAAPRPAISPWLTPPQVRTRSTSPSSG